MSRVRKSGNLAGFNNLRKRLLEIPRAAAIDVARLGAGALTVDATSAYDSGQTIYGSARPGGVDLVATGNVRNHMMAVSDGGTRIRFPMAPDTTKRVKSKGPYMKYLIGKYSILPAGARAALPGSFRNSLNRIAAAVLRRVSWTLLTR